MKKVSILLLVIALVIGFSGISSAETDEIKTLNVWVYDDFMVGEDTPLLEAARDFEEEYPEYIVEFTPITYGSETYRDRFIRVVQGGGGPDVAMQDIIWLPELAAMDLLQPLNDYIGEDFVNEFYEGPVEAARFDNELFGIPFHTNALGIVYNKTVFEEAGLDPDSPPETWEEFREYANIITENTDTHGFGYMGFWGGTYEWLPLFWAFGGEILEDGEAAFTQPEGMEATEFWFEMVVEDDIVPPASMTWQLWDEIAGGLATETVAMTYALPTTLYMLEDYDVDFEWAAAPLPRQKERASMLGGGHLTVGANAEYPEGAAKFIEFLTSEDQLWIFDEYQRISARQDAAEYQEVLEDPNVRVLFESLEFARPRPTIPEWTEIDYNTIQPAFEQILHEDADIQEEMEKAAETVDEDVLE